MTKQQAYKYLATTLEEAIVDAEIPLVYLTGEGSNGNPCPHHLKKLFTAFTALGLTPAANVVEEALNEVARQR